MSDETSERVDYASGKAPHDYRCRDCGAHGVKLWRIASTFCIELRCADCARAYSDTDHGKVDAEGYCLSYRKDRRGGYSAERSDQIGPCVPAVPDEEGQGYWGYTSVPEAGVRWWRALPTRPAKREAPDAR